MNQQEEPQVGDIVRVTYPGPFHGQEVKILRIDRSRSRAWYHLDVKWYDDVARASWFEIFEFEVVKRVPVAAQQDPPEEKSIEIDSGSIELWHVMYAADLEHDEQRGISDEFMQMRWDFYQRLYKFVEEEEPHVERYRLVKIIEKERQAHNDTA